MGARDVARTIDALRRGWPVAVGEVSFLAIETADADGLAAFDGGRRAGKPSDLGEPRGDAQAYQSARGAAGRAGADQAQPPGSTSMPRPRSPIQHSTSRPPLKGPFETAPLCSPPTAAAALRLARLAGLLPALFTRRDGPVEARVSADDVMTFGSGADLRIVSRARLPNAYAEQGEIIAFRADGDTAEHVALAIGAPGGAPPLVRVHSECLTGDALGSLKCDCGPQLGDALAAIAAAGWGILLYLRQEGRGIGLVNKLRAYALQDQGFDTVDANLRLGFQDDERDFAVAARMLEKLGQTRIRLLTNNPAKVTALAAEGIEVVEQVPLKAGEGAHNRAYLATKRDRSGHQL